MDFEPATPPGFVFAYPRTWYAQAEGFYLNRNTSRFTLSELDGTGISSFDYQLQGRLTVGRLRDSTEGFELIYAGPYEWRETFSRVGVNSLNPEFTASGVDDSAFRAAETHTQSYESHLHSAELSKKWWGWDVIATSVGLRYVYLGEEYLFDSVDDTDGFGRLRIDTENHLIGPQIGMDLFYPLGRFRTTLRGKCGLYGNIVNGRVTLDNGGVRQFDNDNNDIQIGFLSEFGCFFDYRVLPTVSLRAGYEFWYLYGFAAATNQPVTTLSSSTGSNVRSKEDVFLHGASVGAEVVW